MAGIAEDQVIDGERISIDVGVAVEKLRCCEDKCRVFLNVGELNGDPRGQLRSIVNGSDGEGFGGESFATVRV